VHRQGRAHHPARLGVDRTGPREARRRTDFVAGPVAGSPGRYPATGPTYTGFVPDNEFDVAVLGGGTGGYTAAIRAALLGKRTVVVEAAKLGGTCLHIGCIPTKTLLETSGLFHKLHDRREEYGIEARDVSLDYERLAKRRDAVVDQLWK